MDLYRCSFCREDVAAGHDGDALAEYTEEELFQHIESFHHEPVAREGETRQEARARFLQENPEAVHCTDCQENQAVWVAQAPVRG